MAAVGTAGLGAIAGGIALGGTTVAYAIGTGGAVAGASSGMISTALSSNGQADFSEYMLAGGVGGFFGGLNGVGSMVGLGTGLAGAGIGSLSGNASAGFQIGDMAGGIASGGIDDYARALGKGASRMGALRHAAARVGVEGGFTVGGGVAGYAATGTMDGAITGASFGQMLGGAIGNLTVACFAAGTPLVVDFEGNSRSIEDIEVDDYDRCYLLLQRIWDRRPSFDECCGLLDQLNDGYDDTGTMFGIIHAIERAVPLVMYEAIAIKLFGLLKRSPEWTRLLIARNLAAVDGQASGHSAYEFLNAVTTKSHPSCMEVVRQVYDEQMKKGEIRQALRHPMLN